PGREVLDRLVSLVNKSLIKLSLPERIEAEPRYTMLETIREFALERLAASGEMAELKRQHAAYFVGLAEVAWRELKGPRQQTWLDCLEEEHSNLRAALDWLVEQADFEGGLQL